ncbi:MAG: M15 family metallopeptidase [Saprospiraceae bacterium]|nr:M15 family metallopeptidase [Saprospiraceae bacterium]
MQQRINKALYLWILVPSLACNNAPSSEQSILMSDTITEFENVSAQLDTIREQKLDYDTAYWIDIADFIPDIIHDIKYATNDNFTNKQIYDCPRCLLRKDSGKALKKAFETARIAGYGMKVFDCYRPAPYQQRLWDVMPDKRYVAPPAKGSMHSRGAAVDLTLIYSHNNEEVDMGTPYDYFGKRLIRHTEDCRIPLYNIANF